MRVAFYIHSAYLAHRRDRTKIVLAGSRSSIEFPYILANTSLGKEKSQDTPCIDDNKFYRNPNAPAHNVWSPGECAKYYLCLGNSVYYCITFHRLRDRHAISMDFFIDSQITKCLNSDALRGCCSMFPDKYVISRRTSTTAM